MVDRDKNFARGFCFFFLLLTSLATSQVNAQQPNALNGYLNARQWNFSEERLALKGDWIWYNFELLDPAGVKAKKGTVIEFPKLWNEVGPGSEGVQGEGYATYALTVLAPQNIHEYSLKIPQVYSSYSLWVNGQLLAVNGKVGKDAESCVPQWLPQTVSFVNDGDSIRIVMQIANFHHSKGGCKEPLFLGESSLMAKKSNVDTISNWSECAVLTILAAVFLAIFLQKRRSATLYFALFCFAWAIRSVFSNRYVFISQFPDFDWTVMVRIEYLMLFLTMIFGTLFIGQLFKTEVNRFLKYALVLISLSFVATALVAPPVVFTRWLFAYLFVAAIILVYGFIIVIRAWINEKAGSTWLTVSIVWVIGIFAYDIFSYEGLFAYNSVIFSAGYVIIFSLMGTALLYYLEVFKSAAPPSRLTFDEMYKNSPKA